MAKKLIGTHFMKFLSEIWAPCPWPPGFFSPNSPAPILQGCLLKLTHPHSPRVDSDLSYCNSQVRAKLDNSHGYWGMWLHVTPLRWHTSGAWAQTLLTYCLISFSSISFIILLPCIVSCFDVKSKPFFSSVNKYLTYQLVTLLSL